MDHPQLGRLLTCDYPFSPDPGEWPFCNFQTGRQLVQKLEFTRLLSPTHIRTTTTTTTTVGLRPGAHTARSMSPSSLSTGHPGLDSALSGLAYGPAVHADAIPPLLVILPATVPTENVVRCLRLAMSAWSIDYHQWDARGTELQPVLDVWRPRMAASARAGTASRWAQGDATRILVASVAVGIDAWGDTSDASSLAWLLRAAPVQLAEAGQQVLVVFVDAATQFPSPPIGTVSRSCAPLFGPASPLGPPGGVTVVGAFHDGSYSLMLPQRPLPMPSPPFEASALPAREAAKRKRSISDEADFTHDDPTLAWDRKKLSSCSYQIPAMSSSRHTYHAHPPSPSRSYFPPPPQSSM